MCKVLVVFCLVTLLSFLAYKQTQLDSADGAIKDEKNRFAFLVIDKNGVPYYNYSYRGYYPIGLQGSSHFVSEQALKLYMEYQRNSNESAKIYFINNVNWLVSTNMLKNEGSFSTYEFSFPWQNGNHTIEPPWRSGTADAEALNALLKAYELTGNKTYLHTAKMLLNSFYVDVKDGGVTYKTPHSGWWYEEYASRNSIKEPKVLNGMIWAVLGINEYYKDTNDSSAKFLFDQGILALKNDLPKYDNNGASFYDRLGLPANSFYKSLHVTLLKKLYDLTQQQIFKTYHDKWNNYNLGRSRLAQIQEINLIDKQHIWKPFSAAIVSQKDTDLDILVVTDVNDKLWNRAYMPIQIKSANNNSLLFNLDYASNSSVGNATFLVEIRDNTSSKVLWNNPLNNTSGQLSNDTFTLPRNILNRPLEFRLYIITNDPGEHSLDVKKATVTIL